jgi:hypothetical protein
MGSYPRAHGSNNPGLGEGETIGCDFTRFNMITIIALSKEL